MLPEKTLEWGTSRCCIREAHAYANLRKTQIDPSKVFDFSIGNPSIPTPDCINETMIELLKGDSVELHSYTPDAGLMSFREAIAADMKKRYNADLSPELIYVTCGAAAGLAAALKGLLVPGDKALAFAPFFPEYRVFSESAGADFEAVMPRESDFQIDFDELDKALDERVKVIIMNSPNNPSGVVFSAETLTRLGDTLRAAEEKYGHSIYLISDEPYRELVYDGVEVPCIFHFYDDSFICYSYSKSLSLPGERLGYLATNPKMTDAETVAASIDGGFRACGYICAPSLMQHAVERNIDAVADISAYKKNRDVLYSALTEAGYSCIKPDGAFYLFVKSLEPDAAAFCERAKKHELMLVPSDKFGVSGYVRISYCVSLEQIENSLPAFRALIAEYK